MDETKHILLVEDNPHDEELTLLAFRQSNIANRIDVVRDGAEAIDYLFGSSVHESDTKDAPPALVLLDIKLPKLDGTEVLRQIRGNRSTRYIPVVMLTSSRQQEDLVKSYDLGANSFIRKPVNFEKFVDAVRQVEVYWLLLNERPG